MSRLNIMLYLINLIHDIDIMNMTTYNPSSFDTCPFTNISILFYNKCSPYFNDLISHASLTGFFLILLMNQQFVEIIHFFLNNKINELPVSCIEELFF